MLNLQYNVFCISSLLISLAVSQVPADQLAATGQKAYPTADNLPSASCTNNPELADTAKFKFRAALGNDDFQGQFNTPMCGKCIKVSGPDGSITAHVVSFCGDGCSKGTIQLTENALTQISKTPHNGQPLAVKWEPTDCAASETGGPTPAAGGSPMGTPPPANKTTPATAAQPPSASVPGNSTGQPAGALAPAQSVPSANSTGGYKVSGMKILDNTGKEFIARGINLQYGDNPSVHINSFEAISKTGANIIRIQLKRTTTPQEVDDAIQATLSRKMVPMLMFWEHATTCTADLNSFFTDLGFWLSEDWKKVIFKNQDQILLNIANEFSNTQMRREDYRNAYVLAIQRMREAGYTCPLVIDGYHCAQYPDSFTYVGQDDSKKVGDALFEADKLKNLIFSFHLYSWLWTNPEDMKKNFETINAAGYPWLVGEHGNDMGGEKIDLNLLYDLAKQYNVGLIAWSWKGNGPGAEHLDMTTDHTALALNTYGVRVVQGNNGISTTSKQAAGIRPPKQ